MRYYNTKNWIEPLLTFHKADTFRKLWPTMLGIAFLSAGIAWLEFRYLRIADNAHLRNIPIMHQLLGFAISMLLVFRTNSAYDRWWEGRKLWGALVNNCRNLAIKLDSMLDPTDFANRNYFRKMVGLFPKEMLMHLQKETTTHALDEEYADMVAALDRSAHMPAQVSKALYAKVQQLYKQGAFSGDQVIVLNAELQSLMDICGACERIKNTPIPYSYSAFIKKFIGVYVITLPFGFAFTLGWISIPVVVFVFYVLASLELIAEEIEDPFGRDSNDLPMERMATNIKGNVYELLTLPAP